MTPEQKQKRASAVRDATGLAGLLLIGAGATGQWGWSVGAMVIGGLLFGLVLAGQVRR